MKYVILGGTIVTPEFIIQGAAITVTDGIITKIGTSENDEDFQVVLEQNDLVFPALINAHDHLLGNYYPRIGTGPYINWLAWDSDLKYSELYMERSHISNKDLYLLGSYRNIISGVTTVSDHMPHSVNWDLIDEMPMRVIKDYTLEHECSSYDLKWGRGITVEHNEAKQKDAPFITHIEEGYDEEACMGIDILSELRALDEYTVLIHGISLSEKDIALIAKQRSHLIWCPSSNYYMFHETTNIRELLNKGVNVAIGTDSPMSGGLNILEEMKFARTLYRQMYHEDLDYKKLVEMVTINAAKALRLKKLGKIEVGYKADLLVLKNGDRQNPYKSLVNSWFDQIKLVTMNGEPIYGDSHYVEMSKHFKNQYQLLEINGSERLLVGKPFDLYHRIWNDVKFKKILPFFPIDFY